VNAFLIFVACGIASYLLGSVPFGYLAARFKGVDIRSVGSGNIGATNVFRSVGKIPGLLTFLCDTLKGFIPAFVFPVLVRDCLPACQDHGLALLCACMAVAGHNWPIYLRFKGGKGIATSAGALLAVAPASVGCALACWVIVFLVGQYVSLASILAAAILAVSSWILYFKQGVLIPIVLSLLGIIGIWRHKSNIRRLLAGQENRFKFGRKKQANNGGERKDRDTG